MVVTIPLHLPDAPRKLSERRRGRRSSAAGVPVGLHVNEKCAPLVTLDVEQWIVPEAHAELVVRGRAIRAAVVESFDRLALDAWSVCGSWP